MDIDLISKKKRRRKPKRQVLQEKKTGKQAAELEKDKNSPLLGESSAASGSNTVTGTKESISGRKVLDLRRW